MAVLYNYLLCTLLSVVIHCQIGSSMADVSCDVVVVGAGMAGLSAASHLKLNGAKVTVLEGRDRLGGRAFTVTNPSNAPKGKGVLELGAQWIHGGVPANPVFNLSLTRNLLGKKVMIYGDDWEGEFEGFFYTSNGRVIDKDLSNYASDIYESIIDSIDFDLEDFDNSRETLDELYWRKATNKMNKLKQDEELDDSEMKDVEACLSGMALNFEVYLSGRLSEGGAFMYGASGEFPGGDVIVPGGVSSIINSLANDLDPQDIKLNEKVTAVAWGGDKVSVTTTTNRYVCNHAIVTIPLGVLKSSPNLFSPQLDKDKLTAICNLREGRLAKLFLHWDQPWWEKGKGFVNFAWTRQEVNSANLPAQWFRFATGLVEVRAQPNLLLMWVPGDAAAAVDAASDQQILSQAGDLVRRFTGNSTLASPTKLFRHKWTTDPFSLGTYSFPSPLTGPQDYDKITSPLPTKQNPRLMLAGEHAHKMYWSYLHGARMSGVKQANVILAFKRT